MLCSCPSFSLVHLLECLPHTHNENYHWSILKKKKKTAELKIYKQNFESIILAKHIKWRRSRHCVFVSSSFVLSSELSCCHQYKPTTLPPSRRRRRQRRTLVIFGLLPTYFNFSVFLFWNSSGDFCRLLLYKGEKFCLPSFLELHILTDVIGMKWNLWQ